MAGLDYALHTLGWRAFQDLCGVVLQQVLGQTFHTFADSNDAGRDGAFHGHWTTTGDAPLTELKELTAASVATVVQCKFSASGTGTLTPSMLTDEVAKAAKLHTAGLCDAYLLMTNLRVTGATDAWLKAELEAIGIGTVMVLDGTWLCQTIRQHGALRRYVPRVYGLGDLSLILDDRGQRQARALLARLSDDLRTFVPTDAYRRAADALASQGFVLLLGEPMCGKSTIAATLAVAALDSWGCGVRRVDTAAELVAGWNPEAPVELFWVDDAFGGIRHDPALTDGWARRMDQVMTAVEQGARIVMTSRDYIYRDARPHLKEYAYPRLREQKVVVDVAVLTPAERRQILYNHLKAGDQPADALIRWRPHLHRVADVPRFEPEVARRLGQRAFARPDRLRTADDLVAFFERPLAFLADVLRALDAATKAAMACVYLSGNELAAPLVLTPSLAEAVARLGATEPEVVRAFQAADGTFLQLAENADGDPVWRFRHPTIREGFAAVIAEDVNVVTVFLDGLSEDELLQQIDCGGAAARGTLVRVPTSLYPRVVPRISVPAPGGTVWMPPAAWFLRTRCSPEFLRAWAAHHHAQLRSMLNFGMYVDAHWQPTVLACLHEAGALPEDLRQEAVAKLSEYAMYFDGGWLDASVNGLFTDAETADLLHQIRETILPDLRQWIDETADGYDSATEPAHRYEESDKAVRAYKKAFEADPGLVSILEEAERYIAAEISNRESDYEPAPRASLAAPAQQPVAGPEGRNEFDDIADGH